MLADVPPPAVVPGPAVQVVHQVNAVRMAAGLGRVHVTKRLERLAAEQNTSMLRSGVFGHDTGNGMSFRWRVRDEPFHRLGEALAWAPLRVRVAPWDVVDGWMRSPGHRRLVMEPKFRRIGVSQMSGFIGGRPGVVTTAEFSTRR